MLLFWLWNRTALLPMRYMKDIIDYSRQKQARIWVWKKEGGACCFCTSYFFFQVLQEQFPFLAEISDRHDGGVIPFLVRYKNRIGIPVGCLLAIVLFSFCSTRIWDIRISGNSRLSDAQVRTVLAQVGLSEGRLLAGIDTKKIAGDTLLLSNELAFVGINLRGTVAYVHVMEHVSNREDETLLGGANLIASADAVIDSLSVKQGNVCVQPGRVVKKGDLLVSGITEGSTGSKLVCATGEVYGRVEQHFEICIPRTYPQTTETKREIEEISLVLWGKNINIYHNTGNYPSTYDTIYEKQRLYLGYNLRTPFEIVKKSVVTEEDATVFLDDEAMVRLAYRRSLSQIQLSLCGGELLQKKLQGRFTEEGYILSCDVMCLKNIAEVAEIDTVK